MKTLLKIVSFAVSALLVGAAFGLVFALSQAVQRATT